MKGYSNAFQKWPIILKSMQVHRWKKLQKLRLGLLKLLLSKTFVVCQLSFLYLEREVWRYSYYNSREIICFFHLIVIYVSSVLVGECICADKGMWDSSLSHSLFKWYRSQGLKDSLLEKMNNSHVSAELPRSNEIVILSVTMNHLWQLFIECALESQECKWGAFPVSLLKGKVSSIKWQKWKTYKKDNKRTLFQKLPCDLLLEQWEYLSGCDRSGFHPIKKSESFPTTNFNSHLYSNESDMCC